VDSRGSAPRRPAHAGRDAAALLARPEQNVPKVKLQHVLLAFVGATRAVRASTSTKRAGFSSVAR